MRTPAENALLQEITLYKYGVTAEIVGAAVKYVHEIMDSIDTQLMTGADSRFSGLVELANLSAIIGNLLQLRLAFLLRLRERYLSSGKKEWRNTQNRTSGN